MKIPAFLFPLLNPIVTALLNSPLHGLMSDSVLVLYYTGRKSGQPRSTPVRYCEEGALLVLVTEHTSGWWPNFAETRTATVQLQGQRLPVRATAFKPPTPQVAARVRQMLAAHPADAAYMGIKKDAAASQANGHTVWDEASLAAANRRLVAVELQR